MANRKRNPSVFIKRTRHGKPYYEVDLQLGENGHESPLHDALDFPGDRGRDEIEAVLRTKSPDVKVRDGTRRLNLISELRSVNRKIERDEFMTVWRHLMAFAKSNGSDEVNDPFRRFVRVRLSGKDRVRPWSGWFHYPLLIEINRRQLQECSERLKSLFEQSDPVVRDVIEEAYFEQVTRERLAIFERRREWWRVIRWGSTTALGMVLAAWSLMQIVDRVIGG